MKYDSIPFTLIEPSNLNAIAEGTQRIAELMASPLWTSTYNTYAPDNKVNVDFFADQTMEEEGVPVELARMMAKAVRDAFHAGSEAYMGRIGAAVLDGNEIDALFRANENDITLLFAVLCGSFQVGRWKEGVPEYCFCAAIVAGMEATEANYQYQTRPVFIDPLTKYPHALELRNGMGKYPALVEFAAAFFKDQTSVMLQALVAATGEEERAEIVKTFGEATFAIGITLSEVAPDIATKSVQEIGQLLGDFQSIINAAKRIASDETESLVRSQSEVLSDVFAAIGEGVLSPIAFSQTLVAAGVDYGLSLRNAKH